MTENPLPRAPAQGETATLGEPAVPWARPARVEEPELERGQTIGRFWILERLGAGGMGVVYAAYDPELDRKVAIKLLHPERAGEGERLLGEAQAAARLSHPHTVAVYDVGTLGGQVFLAMEYVAGTTLRQWLAARRRTPAEILATFAAAGRGLAAIHAAGLAHGDFKPDNVLVGDDGRVRVADFGLARRLVAAAGDDEGASAVLGTLAYMAPEQLRGEAADAASDQWSFAAALYEALYGARPYPGGTGAERLEAFARGLPAELPAALPSGHRLPARIRRALARGLGIEPAGRFPDLPALVAELERHPEATVRRFLLWGGAVALVGGATAGIVANRVHEAGLCHGAEARLAGVWDAPRQAAVHAAFRATGTPFAEVAYAGVARSLSRYTASWAAMHREACEATRISGEQSEDLLDRRMLCLDGRLAEARALSDLFARADAQVVAKAREAVGGLTPLSACADKAALSARVPPPRDPAERRRLAEIETRLAEASALKGAGKETEALARLAPAIAAIPRLAYRPLVADVLYEQGFLEDRLGRSREAEGTVFRAFTAAEAGGDTELAALAASELSWVVGHELAQTAAGERWGEVAEALAARLPADAEIRAILDLRASALLDRQGRYAEEASRLETAAERAEKSPAVPRPTVASLWSNLGGAYNQMGRFTESLAASQRGLVLRQRHLEPDHPDLGKSHFTLGGAYLGLFQPSAALPHLVKAEAIFRANYGPYHPMTVYAESSLGICFKDMKRLPEALAQFRGVLAGIEGQRGPEHPDVAVALTQLGEVYLLLGRFAEARAAYERALAIDQKAFGADSAFLAFDLQGIGIALWNEKRAEAAAASLERAVALREHHAVSPQLLAESRFYLAHPLWDLGSRRRAQALVRQARAQFAKLKNARGVADADAWLVHRGLPPSS